MVPLNGNPVYVTLRTYWPNNGFYERTFEYQTATSGTDSGTQLTSPAPGSTLSDQITDIHWQADAQASRISTLGWQHAGRLRFAECLVTRASTKCRRG